MSHYIKNRTLPARIQIIRPLHLLLVDHRHKEIRREKQQGPVELRRRHAEDGKRMLVDLNCAAHNATIILKMYMPVRVAEHNVRSAVRAMLIGAMEETAKIWLD